MTVPLQYGGQRGYGASQRGHHFVVPAFGFRSFLLAVAATVSAIKVVTKQLWHSEYS